MTKKEKMHVERQKGGHSATTSNYEMLYGEKIGKAGVHSVHHRDEDHERNPQEYTFAEWMRINRSGIENPFIYLKDSPLVKMLMQKQSLRKANAVQAKLKVSQPGDESEREADRVAERVMSSPQQTVSREVKNTEEEEGKIAAKQHDYAGGLELDPDTERKIGNLGAGKQLPETEREFYESRFGTDFSGVRVHDNSFAHEIAAKVNARALTLGKDIVFGSGEYAPSTHEGKKLIAHELGHVVQQGKLRHVIQKREIRDFPDENHSVDINQACDRAVAMLENAINILPQNINSSSEMNSRLVRLFDWHFKSVNPSDMIFVRDNLIRIAQNFDSLNFEYETVGYLCGTRTRGYNLWTNTIHVCPHFFDLNINARAETIIHEAAHAILLLFRDTYNDRPEYRNLSTSYSLRNPDSYSGLVRDLWR